MTELRPYAHLYYHHLFEKVHTVDTTKKELLGILSELELRDFCKGSQHLKVEVKGKIKHFNDELTQEKVGTEQSISSPKFGLQDIPTTHQRFIDQTANIHHYLRARLSTEYFRDHNSFVQERVFRLAKYLEAKEKKQHRTNTNSELSKVATMTFQPQHSLSAKELNEQSLHQNTEFKDVVFPQSLIKSHLRVLEWRDDLTVGEFIEQPFERYDVSRGDLFRMKNFCVARVKLYSRQPSAVDSLSSPLEEYCDRL